MRNFIKLYYYLKLSMVCVSSFGIKFSFATVGLLLPFDNPLLLIETSSPPNPLFMLVFVVDTVVIGFKPNNPPVGTALNNAAIMLISY